MAISPRSDSFEVTDYAGVLRRRWWIVFGLACLGTLAAAAYVAVTPKSYTATSSVQVTANAANVNNVAGSRTNTGPTVNMDNEAQVVQSTTVAAQAGKYLRLRRPLLRHQLSPLGGELVDGGRLPDGQVCPGERLGAFLRPGRGRGRAADGQE